MRQSISPNIRLPTQLLTVNNGLRRRRFSSDEGASETVFAGGASPRLDQKGMLADFAHSQKCLWTEMSAGSHVHFF